MTNPPDPNRKIVITSDDLAPDPVTPQSPVMPTYGTSPTWGAPGQSVPPGQPTAPWSGQSQWVNQGPPGGLPGLGQQPGPRPFGAFTGMTQGTTIPEFLLKLGSNTIISGLVAGAVGGFLGFVFSEIFNNPDTSFATTQGGAVWDSALWTMIFGIFLGFVLLGWEGFTSLVPQKMLIEGGIGAGVGLAAGLIGGSLSQVIYHALGGGSDSASNILIRGFAWCIFGAMLGLGIGIRGGGRKVINGLAGGAAGGLLGGMLFQIFGMMGAGGGADRFFGLIVTGVGIGLGIGLVERVRRDAWLQFVAGPMTGKEFILYAAQTSVGSDFRCDIVLVKDTAVAPRHAVFVRHPNGSTSVVSEPSIPVFVNGAPATGLPLRTGDTITIGASTLAYQERPAPMNTMSSMGYR